MSGRLPIVREVCIGLRCSLIPAEEFNCCHRLTKVTLWHHKVPSLESDVLAVLIWRLDRYEPDIVDLIEEYVFPVSPRQIGRRAFSHCHSEAWRFCVLRVANDCASSRRIGTARRRYLRTI